MFACLLAWLFSFCRGAERIYGLFASNPTWDLGICHPKVALLPSWSLAAFGFAGHSAEFFFTAHTRPRSSGTRTFLALQVNFSFWPLALRTVTWLFPFHLCEQRLLIFSNLGASDPEIGNLKKRLKSFRTVLVSQQNSEEDRDFPYSLWSPYVVFSTINIAHQNFFCQQ